MTDRSDDASAPSLLYLVGRVDRLVSGAINDVVRRHGISTAQYTALSVLARRGGLSNAQLARRSLVSSQSMNEVLLALERRELVRRQAHPDHGRILQTRLTPKGRRLLTACDAEVGQVEAAMISGLGHPEQVAFRRSLLNCVHALHGGLTGD